MNDSNWLRLAACAGTDPNLFFGHETETYTARTAREAEAKAVCSRCPVTSRCLSFASQQGEQYGTWGGLNEEERTARARSTRRPSLVPALQENAA